MMLTNSTAGSLPPSPAWERGPEQSGGWLGREAGPQVPLHGGLAQEGGRPIRTPAVRPAGEAIHGPGPHSPTAGVGSSALRR